MYLRSLRVDKFFRQPTVCVGFRLRLFYTSLKLLNQQQRQRFSTSAKDLHSVEDLSKYSFWKTKYAQKKRIEAFDWFIDSKELYPYIESHIAEIVKRGNLKNVLYAELGCGMSELPVMLFKESNSSLQLVLTDYVMEALQHQAHLFQNVEPMNNQSSTHFICADVLNLPFRDNSLTLVVDKGTMDAVLKDEANGQAKAECMMAEAMRVLAIGGRFLQVTDEDPDSRLLLLERYVDGLANAATVDSFNSCDSLKIDLQPLLTNSDHECTTKKRNENNRTSNGRRSSIFKMSTWSFKVISMENPDREYFMYWIDKQT